MTALHKNYHIEGLTWLLRFPVVVTVLAYMSSCASVISIGGPGMTRAVFLLQRQTRLWSVFNLPIERTTR